MSREVQVDYVGRVDDFLKSADPPITLVLRLLGDACPYFCDDKGKPGIGEFPRTTHIHGQHWVFTFNRAGGKVLSSEFWDSYRDSLRRWLARNWGREFVHIQAERQADIPKHHKSWMFPPKGWKDIKPSAYDILSCLTLYDPGTFEDWCSDCGYDTDSRKAETVHRLCCEEWRQVRSFFTRDETETLREIAT